MMEFRPLAAEMTAPLRFACHSDGCTHSDPCDRDAVVRLIELGIESDRLDMLLCGGCLRERIYGGWWNDPPLHVDATEPLRELDEDEDEEIESPTPGR
jgi:hypothetical protein